jgi:hypothetical protein
MKSVSVREAEGQLGQLVAEACRGETIVLTDGDKQVTLAPRGLDLEEDSPELEAELLEAVEGHTRPCVKASCEKLRIRRCVNIVRNGRNETAAASR